MKHRVQTILILLSCILLTFCFETTQSSAQKASFVGSEKCSKCHEEIYKSWSHTRMANVVRDPREHPEAVLGDFKNPDPVRTFTLDDVAFVYGSRYKLLGDMLEASVQVPAVAERA